MIDIHCHLLPGIDDGAQDMDEALTLLQMAVDLSQTGVVWHDTECSRVLTEQSYSQTTYKQAWSALYSLHKKVRHVTSCKRCFFVKDLCWGQY